ARGQVQTYDHGLFLEPSWLAVYLGQGVTPDHYDPRVDEYPEQKMFSRLEGMKNHIRTSADQMMSHADWIARHCPTPIAEVA
ncbi:MAG: tryptophan 7-halogenase, partial [Henriciella sp.]|nr:tryptophan 7-halogenase [Henriciella sp.]